MSNTKFSFSLPMPSEARIGKRIIGLKHPTFVIAEIGNNHNGDIEIARRSVQAAAFAGADAVKFQKRALTEVFTDEMLQKPQTSSRQLGTTYGEYRQSLELSEVELIELRELAHSLGMAFGVTPFDLESVSILRRLEMDFWKVASFDVNHRGLLEAVADQQQPIFLSTGMSTLEERDEAVATITARNSQLVPLHCVSVYPTQPKDYNIGAVRTMRKRYAPLPVGYSGHEKGFIPTLIAVALGARAVERHFTLDTSMPGPDHATVSLDPIEFAEMVRQIRRVEVAVIDDRIYLHDGELQHRQKHGKTVVAKIGIVAGTVITVDMLACKSTGQEGGIKPTLIDTVIGRTAKIDIAKDTMILEEYLE